MGGKRINKRKGKQMKQLTDDEIKKEIQGCSDEEICNRIKGIESVIRDGIVIEGGKFPLVGLYDGVYRDPEQVLQWLKEEKDRRLELRVGTGF